MIHQSLRQASPRPKPQKQVPSELQKYVVLPQHPLYGHLVKVVHATATTTYVDCLIEDSSLPGFRYHIHDWWLSASPPPPALPAKTQSVAICLALPALDRMVQLLLTKALPRRNSQDGTISATSLTTLSLPNPEFTAPDLSTDLGPATPVQQGAPLPASFLSGSRPNRRDQQ